jgi:hypothetical protein
MLEDQHSTLTAAHKRFIADQITEILAYTWEQYTKYGRGTVIINWNEEPPDFISAVDHGQAVYRVNGPDYAPDDPQWPSAEEAKKVERYDPTNQAVLLFIYRDVHGDHWIYPYEVGPKAVYEYTAYSN